MSFSGTVGSIGSDSLRGGISLRREHAFTHHCVVFEVPSSEQKYWLCRSYRFCARHCQSLSSRINFKATDSRDLRDNRSKLLKSYMKVIVNVVLVSCSGLLILCFH